MLCHFIKQHSHEVFNWMNGFPTVNEESITDWFLYKTGSSGKGLIYVPFNRNQENHIGADFEIWIVNDNQNFRGRIQAKKLLGKKNYFNYLAYPKKSKKQIQTLIDKAVKHKNKYRPLYAFYSASNHKSNCSFDLKHEGIYIADATQVKVMLDSNKRISDTDLIDISIPFSCWFCCPIVTLNGQQSINYFFDQYYPSIDLEGDSIAENEFSDIPLGVSTELPSEIRELISKARTNNFYPSGWIADYRESFSGVNGLLVLDNRTEK